MASKVYKWGSYWRFCFTDKKKKPRQKWLYFSANTYKKSDVQKLKRTYEHARKEGRFDPWVDEAPRDTVKAKTIWLSDAIDKYKQTRKRELSPTTLLNYSSQLKGIHKVFGDIDLANVDMNEVQAHINSLNSLRHRKLRATLFNQLFKQNDIDKYARAYGTKQEKQKKGAYLTKAEFDGLIETVRNNPSLNKPVDQRVIHVKQIEDIFNILFFMGLRINELLYLRPAWVLQDYKFLRIGDKYEWKLADEFHPKSQRETDNPIAIPREVRQILKAHTQDLGLYERPFIYTRQNIVNRFKRYARLAGIDKNVYPHMLRDSCISYWLNERGKPIQEVMRLARHESINTTMIYYHQSDETHFDAFN